MFKNIFKRISKLYRSRSLHDDLESQIIRGNPQTAADIENLERGFYQRYRRDTLWNSKDL